MASFQTGAFHLAPVRMTGESYQNDEGDERFHVRFKLGDASGAPESDLIGITRQDVETIFRFFQALLLDTELVSLDVPPRVLIADDDMADLSNPPF